MGYYGCPRMHCNECDQLIDDCECEEVITRPELAAEKHQRALKVMEQQKKLVPEMLLEAEKMDWYKIVKELDKCCGLDLSDLQKHAKRMASIVDAMRGI